jgi:heavy metal translocating P-type ATPase
MAVNSARPSVATGQLCKLCSLPIRAAIYEKTVDGIDAFCCAGCRNVWRILVESGGLSTLDDPRQSPLFQKAQSLGIIGAASEYSIVGNDTSSIEITPEQKGGTIDDNRQTVIQINGMWCSSCAWLIAQTLLRGRGVIAAEVSFTSDTARVIYKPAKTDESVLAKSISDLGYSAAPFGEGNDTDPRQLQRKRELLRVVICFAFAMNVMMMQLILYAGYFEGIAGNIKRGLPWLLLALSIPVVASASMLYHRAFQAARQGVATMETLIVLGSSAAFAYSIWQTVCGSGHVYYDTADMLLGLVMVGKYIETGARQNANDALTLLYGLLPRKAVIVKSNIEFTVAISQISADDCILVRAGERIAADGIIESGAATVDESLLSGESRPVNKRLGDIAIGGTVLMNGILTIRVNRVGDAGTLNQIVKHVEEALAQKTSPEKMADRISRFFVPIVVALAALTGAYLFLVVHASPDIVMTRIVAVLVIACPCALGIATPMAISAGVAKAAQSGILISDGGVFELLRRINYVVFDKTGTVTDATFGVRRMGDTCSSFEYLSAIETQSNHPIAKAIVSAYPLDLEEEYFVTDFQINDGAGISALVNEIAYYAGNERAVDLAGATISDGQRTFAENCRRDGLTVIYWGKSGRTVSGAIALGDKIRPEAQEGITMLTSIGIPTELLSGDSAVATDYTATQLSIGRYRGGVTPTEKAELIASMRSSERRVCMVGDGVNDAPALAQADVGIALATGADIAARTAQVTLLTPDLRLVAQLIKLSRQTVSIMYMNLFWAFLYNFVCIPLAIAGYITPLWAVIAMLISSLTVILNTLRLRRRKT